VGLAPSSWNAAREQASRAQMLIDSTPSFATKGRFVFSRQMDTE